MAYGVKIVDPSTAPWLSAAKTAGYWEEEGLDVEVTGFDGASPALQLLSSGQVDAVFTGTPDLYKLRQQGVGIRAVASAYDQNHIYPVVHPDSDITSIEDFRGKSIGMQSMTGSIYLWTLALLEAHGLTEDDLGSVTTVGTGATAAEAFKSNDIDILAEWHGHYALLEEVFDLEFQSFDDDPVLQENSFVQAFYVSEEMIEQDPELVEGLLRGVAKAVIFSDQNPEAAAIGHFEQFPSTKPTGVSEEQATAEAAAVIKKNVQLSIEGAYDGDWGLATQEEVDRVSEVLIDADLISESLPADEYFDDQFIEEINDFSPDEVIEDAKQ